MAIKSPGGLLSWLLVAAIAISGVAAIVTVVINSSASKTISTEAERSLLVADMQVAAQTESEAAAGFVAHLPGASSGQIHEGANESVHSAGEDWADLADHPEVQSASASFNRAAVRLLALSPSPTAAEDVETALASHEAFTASLGRLNDAVHADSDAMSVYHSDTQVVQSELSASLQRLRLSVIGRLAEAVERSEWSHTLSVLILPFAATAAIVAAVWLARTRKARLRVRVLEHVISEKDRFIGAISHEIRTPMAAIIGFTELLSSGDTELTEGEKREYLSLVLNQGNEVSAIVDDLLVAARADIGDLSVVAVPVNLSAQARQVVETLNFPGSRPTVPETSVLGLGDPARVRQIVRNLLTNAIRHGGPRIRIEISEGEEMLTIRVRDNGEPIPVEERDRIFDAYTTIADTGPVTGSIGLGLSVSRQLAYLMGGHLWYQRTEDENVFVLTLPTVSESDRPDSVSGWRPTNWTAGHKVSADNG